jgi:hypothetical protein
MRHVRVFRARRRQNWPLRGSPESLGVEAMNKTVPTEMIGCILDAGQDAKTEILVPLNKENGT